MPKQGNWGDWAVIDLPPTEKKYVSCYTCSYYYEEDGSCLKTSIIPHIDGNKSFWKNCDYFELAPEYMTTSFMESVCKVKGKNFFDKKNEPVKSKVEHKKIQEKALICDYEIGSWIKSDHYGKGILIDAYPGKIVIDFQGKQRKFLYPQAFDECKLFLVYEPMKKEDADEMGIIVETKEDVVREEQVSVEAINAECSVNTDMTTEETLLKNSENLISDDQHWLDDQNNEDGYKDRDIVKHDSNKENIGDEYSYRRRLPIFDRGISWIKSLFGR